MAYLKKKSKLAEDQGKREKTHKAQRDLYGGERYGAALVGRKNTWPTLILQDPDNFNTTVLFFLLNVN